MELLVVALILVILIGGGLFLFSRLRASPTVERAARLARPRTANPGQPRMREPTLQTLEPGDAIAFGDGTHGLVVTVLDCREQVGQRVSTWRWNFLDDGKLIEAAPDGNVVYDRWEVAYQGSELFERIVTEASRGGILKLFEQRVRAGTIGSNPLTFEHAGLTFQMRSTGTFVAKVAGKEPGEVWADISQDAGDNVYFEAEAASGEQLLGIWTTHIMLLVGQPIRPSDIDAIYPGTEGVV